MTVRMSFLDYRLTFRSELNSDSNSCAGISSSCCYTTIRMSFSGCQLTFRSDLNCNSNSYVGMNAYERYATVGHTYYNFGKSSEVSVTVPSVPRVIFGHCVDRFADFCTKKGESKFGYQQLPLLCVSCVAWLTKKFDA